MGRDGENQKNYPLFYEKKKWADEMSPMINLPTGGGCFFPDLIKKGEIHDLGFTFKITKR